MARHSVLIIEDNEDIRFLLAAGLKREGYAVHEARNGHEAIMHLEQTPPSIVLLDLMLPDQSGLSLIPVIKEHTDAPIIIVSAKSQLVEKIVGLESGADDYVPKPFQLEELLARIRAHLRRHEALTGQTPRPGHKISFGQWTLDPVCMELVSAAGIPAGLTPSEFKMLHLLVSSPNVVFSRHDLLEKNHNDNMDITDRAIDTQMTRIGKKIGRKPDGTDYIKSIRGIGYSFQAPTTLLNE